MKKTLLILALMATVLSVNAQRVSSRAKAVRMLAYARPEYQVKDVIVYAVHAEWHIACFAGDHSLGGFFEGGVWAMFSRREY